VLCAVVLAAGTWAGCSLEDSGVPALTSPSGFSTAVTLTASPARLPRDGSSESIVTVTVRDAANSPVPDQRLSVAADIGNVTESEVVTDGDGHATFAFIAPDSSVPGSAAVIRVVPIGANADAAIPRTLTISFTGGPPSPAFTVTPPTAAEGVSRRFDASATTDEGAPCLDACTYSWNFGDFGSGTGRIVSRTYRTPGTYTAVLTVTDAAGASASTSTIVTVSDVAAPTVVLAVTPSPPLAGQSATLRATATPAGGHEITRYTWTFGDGTTGSTSVATTAKTYSIVGTYVVTVTARDDIGQTASASLQFTIVGSGVTASFTVSPTGPVVSQTTQFNGSTSSGSAGATITEWAWDFGDGSTSSESDATTSHSFSPSGTYVVRLTVTDSAGRTGTTTANVVVAAP